MRARQARGRDKQAMPDRPSASHVHWSLRKQVGAMYRDQGLGSDSSLVVYIGPRDDDCLTRRPAPPDVNLGVL